MKNMIIYISIYITLSVPERTKWTLYIVCTRKRSSTFIIPTGKVLGAVCVVVAIEWCQAPEDPLGLLKDIPVLKIIVTVSTFTVYQKTINKVGMNGMMPSSTRLFWF